MGNLVGMLKQKTFLQKGANEMKNPNNPSKTSKTSKVKPPSKGQMLATTEQAISKMEWPFEVRLTPKAKRDLRAPANYTYLTQAYTWANYILTWQYGRMYSDDINADYGELINILERMYTDRVLDWSMKEQ